MRAEFLGGRCNDHAHAIAESAPQRMEPPCPLWPDETEEDGVYVLSGSGGLVYADMPPRQTTEIYTWTPAS